MKKFVLFTLILLIMSCKKEGVKNVGFVLDASVDMKLINNQGVDLLNSNIDNTYNTSDIRLYYLQGGQVKQYNGGSNQDYPKGYFIFLDSENYNNIRIFLNHDDNEEYPITYIKWNELDTDTIKTHYKRSQTIIALDSIWYNGMLHWTFNSNVRHVLEISK